MAGKKEKIKILAIDDDKEFLSLLDDILKEEGYEVTLAESPSEAVNRIKENPFDLIITDKNMPDPKGVELIKKIKTIRPDSRIIVLTAFGDVESYLELMNLGAYDYLNKPIKISDLKLKVKNALSIIEVT